MTKPSSRAPHRREFSVADQVAMVRRATVDGRIECEKCHRWLKTRAEYQFDHVIPEGMRSAADKQRKLTAAEGRLLCVETCHSSKTRRDVADIAQAKRREARDLAIESLRKTKMRNKEKPRKKLLEVAVGAPGMARRFRGIS